MQRLFLLSALLFVGLSAAPPGAFAQKAIAPEDGSASRKPVWVAMLDDTAANYFVVERAFNDYFLHHELPEGEQEVIGEHREREKIPSKRKQRRMAKENALRMEVKRYYF